MNIPSRYIEQAVDQVSSLPGIGKKTALRLVLSLLRRKPDEVDRFTSSITEMMSHVKLCNQCHNLSDLDVCAICSSPFRDKSLVCVVADIRDVMAIESTEQYRGTYHVLGGIISPMDGVGPSDLFIDGLIQRTQSGEVQEIILALSATMEGETTCFYLSRRLADFNVRISAIARGVAVGGELEYTDEVTLGRSILQRTPYENALKR
ncbi:MAG: recombination mediator RecR [Flavobacteriales bacterium]